VSNGLLSRIAETLFWIGRYIERADDTARMVDVYVHRLLEEPHADEDAGCRALLAILGIPAPEDTRLDVGTALDQLAYDQKSESTIAGAVLAARTGARSVREVISSEMWECLNVTAHGLPGQRRAAERLGPHVYLRFVRERAALFFGLADSTMPLCSLASAPLTFFGNTGGLLVALGPEFGVLDGAHGERSGRGVQRNMLRAEQRERFARAAGEFASLVQQRHLHRAEPDIVLDRKVRTQAQLLCNQCDAELLRLAGRGDRAHLARD